MERMFSLNYKKGVVERLIELFNNYKSTENEFNGMLLLIVKYYCKDFIEELDINISNSDTCKYNDYRCIDFIHRWGDLCRYYKTFYKEQFRMLRI